MTRSEAQKRAEKKYEEKHKEERKNRSDYWLFEFYPESCPKNWKEIINSWLVDCLVSPLHDKDVNENDTPKKPHYHGILFFDSAKSYEQVKELLAPLNGPIPIKPKGSKRNCTRYLCHLNNPEKHRYNEADVTEFQNADYQTLKVRDNDKYGYIGEMMDFIDEQGVYSYAKLLRYSRKERPEWFRCLCDNGTYVMKEYCKTAAHDAKQARVDEWVKREEARKEAGKKDTAAGDDE